MTTHTYSGSVVNGSDADFRAWGLALSNALTTAGFPKSADTGQINWATVTRPAANTAAGYEIRYLNDSLHATKPCYVKVEYGSQALNTIPGFWIECGTGTNGAGTITGVMLTRLEATPQAVPSVGNYPTYICVKEGYVACAHARGSKGGQSNTFFSVARTCDSSGTPTSTGFHFTYGLRDGSNDLRFNRKTYITSQVDDAGSACFFPGGSATTLVGSDVQVMRHFGFQPTIECIPFYLGFLYGEIGNEATFVATPVGVTARTYLALSGSTNIGSPINCSATLNQNHKLAMQFD